MFFTAQIANWTGTWFVWVAQNWLVLKLTQSGFALGLVTVLAWSPILVFGPWGRCNCRSVRETTRLAIHERDQRVRPSTARYRDRQIVTLWMVVVIALLLGSLRRWTPGRLTNAGAEP
jgi:hypothetical protein